jgi:hypothetical protein
MSALGPAGFGVSIQTIEARTFYGLPLLEQGDDGRDGGYCKEGEVR